jgi:RNA polymerase sigma-70 factor (ECF subfamily)
MHDVDDIVHDSYVQVLQRQPAGRIASVRAYLFTVAHHAVLRVFRRRRIWSEVPLSDLPPARLVAAEPDAAEALQLRQRETLAAEAIAQLPARCREIFELRAGLGLSHAEIAARLGLAEATVRVQVARGLQKCVLWLRAQREKEEA